MRVGVEGWTEVRCCGLLQLAVGTGPGPRCSGRLLQQRANTACDSLTCLPPLLPRPAAGALQLKRLEQREWTEKVDSLSAGDLPRYIEARAGAGCSSGAHLY